MIAWPHATARTYAHCRPNGWSRRASRPRFALHGSVDRSGAGRFEPLRLRRALHQDFPTRMVYKGDIGAFDHGESPSGNIVACSRLAVHGTRAPLHHGEAISAKIRARMW